jgi:signal peptidase I
LEPYKAGRKPERGDVIVFPLPEDPTELFIKRVIALEEEKLEIRNKEIHINDKPLEDPWGVFFPASPCPET